MEYDFESDEFEWNPGVDYGDSANAGSGSAGGGDSTDYAGIVGASLEGIAAIIAASIGNDDPSGSTHFDGVGPTYKPTVAAPTPGIPPWVLAAGGGLALLLLMRSRR